MAKHHRRSANRPLLRSKKERVANQPLPQTVIWIIIGFILVAAVMVYIFAT